MSSLLKRKPRLPESSDAAFLGWLGGRRRRFVIRTVIELVIVVLVVLSLAHNSVAPRTLAALRSTVASLTAQNAQLSQQINGFPVNSVQGAAMKAAANCTSYSDQLTNTQMTDLETACGWDGNGVGNPTVPQFDPSLALRPAVSQGLTALPFSVQFLGSRNWDTYYVPVKQTGASTAVVAGHGAFLATPPSFVIHGCVADNSVADPQSNAGVQAVQGLISGAARFSVNGSGIAVAGGDLTGAKISDASVCQGGIVIATITLSGPTAKAHFEEGLAFRVVPGANGDLVSGIGLNTNWQPTI